jgi:hypothetical protein
MAGYRVNLTPNNRTRGGEREGRTDVAIPLAVHVYLE